MPDGVVNFCPGSGATFGNAIVEHPKTRFIAFTGSKAVGLEIHERAANTQPGQIWIKRTILEMGGKDSIIVSADADLDAAVEGVVASAFGFSGQKCSACSRAIVEAPIYDVFCRAPARARRHGSQSGDPAANPDLGPVINQAALDNHARLHRDRQEGRPAASPAGTPSTTADGGYYLEPTVFADIAPDARHRAGRDLRPRAGRHQGRPASTRPSRSPTTPSTASPAPIYSTDPRQARPRPRRVPRRQSLLQPQVHRRHGRRASLRRLQHERHRLQGRRPGLPLLFTQAKSIAEKITAITPPLSE